MSKSGKGSPFANPLLLVVGGAGALAAAYFAKRRSDSVVDTVRAAIAGLPPPSAPGEPQGAVGAIPLRLTGYWPFVAKTAAEKKMEGGLTDRMSKPLHTLEQHRDDPVKHPYVSLSGDDAIWPYGQRVVIPELGPNVVARVVDTGSHFRGINKVIRVAGREPIDVCVNSPDTKVPKLAEAIVVVGDDLAGRLKKGTVRDVAYAKLQKPVLAGDAGDCDPVDRDVLARAIESERRGATREEQAAAGWVVRNRARKLGKTVYSLLLPNGKRGSVIDTGGFASTRLDPSPGALDVASEVLSAPQSADPTGGAVDFWVPSLQDKMRALGDLYRAAVRRGDKRAAEKYDRWSGYEDGEYDVREANKRAGMRVVGVVGSIELLAPA